MQQAELDAFSRLVSAWGDDRARTSGRKNESFVLHLLIVLVKEIMGQYHDDGGLDRRRKAWRGV
jgi:hypothetical protein